MTGEHPSPRTGGRILVDQLHRHGVRMAFCVPGESYLAALDALNDEIHHTAARLVAEIVPRSAATLTGELRERALDGGAVDIAAQFSQKFPISVIAEMLGLPEDDRPQFIDWYTRLMAFVTNYAADPEVNARGVQAKQELTEVVEDAWLARASQRRRTQWLAAQQAGAPG